MDAQPQWRAFEANEITHSAAHYLLAIESFAQRDRPPRAADVARSLGVSRAAASLQLRSLHDHGLVESDAGGRLLLTAPGLDVVGRVASKREVLEVFLAQVLGIAEDTARADACKIEHLLSDDSGAALLHWVRFLRSGNPAAATTLAAFRETRSACRTEGRCELCGDS